MSKRWKVRKRNAAKLERSRVLIAQFHDNVISALEQAGAQAEQGKIWCAACGQWGDHGSATCTTIIH